MTDKTITQWPLRKLKEHPQQQAVFGDLPDAELDALVEDMRKHGQRVPVEALPDGCIVAGHQRVRAAKRLGWTHVDVVVRHDLAKAGKAAVEEAFITDNLIRRHLTPLARARVIRRLLEVEAAKQGRSFGNRQKEALKTKIATLLHLSGRSVNRYLAALQTPAPVQAAFDRGDLTLVNAGKVALLSDEAQAEIARRIEAGEKAAKVVAEHLAGRQTWGDRPGRALLRLLAAVQRETPRLQGKEKELDADKLQRHLPALVQAEGMLARIIKVARRGPDLWPGKALAK